jgi:GT2 family glycosyltransferase
VGVKAELPDVTAVICTRDRPALAQRAIASLTAQHSPAREILVVDNAPSSDETRLMVARDFPQVRYIREPVAGLDVARNRALQEASAAVVAFLDDDAIAAPGWTEATQRAFAADPRIALCTGRVEALTLSSPGARLFEANGGFARGDRPIHVGRDRPRHGRPLIAWSISIGSGCSMAVRRALVLRLGGFDDALDLGPELPGGGDLDMIWRVLDAGYHAVYQPAVRAAHEHRASEAEAVRQIVEHNRSLIAVLVKALRAARGMARVPIAAFLGWRLSKPGIRLLARLVGRDPLPVRALAQLWVACWRGLVTYRRALPIAEQRRAAARATP